MSGKDRLRDRIGSNVQESIGAGGGGNGPAMPAPAFAKDPKMAGIVRPKGYIQIPLARVVEDEGQPRKEFDPDELEALARSLKAHGQAQAGSVWYRESDDKYVVIFGARRRRAAEMAGLEFYEAKFYDPRPSDEQISILQLIENTDRSDLKPIEQAKAVQALIEIHGLTQDALAKEKGVSQTAIANYLSLLKLAPEVQEKVDSGELAPAAAYPLAGIESPESQIEAANAIVEGKLNKEEARKVARDAKAREKSSKPAPKRAPKPKVAPRLDKTFKVTFQGIRIVAERDKGLDPDVLVIAFQEALDKAKARRDAASGRAVSA